MQTSTRSIEIPKISHYAGLFALFGILLALIAFSGPLAQLVDRWGTQEEYSHGYLVPLVTLWMLWARRDALSLGPAVWTGPAAVLVAVIMHLIGEMGAMPILSQVGFILALIGVVLSVGGYQLLQATIIPILFLLFAIPMPHFIDGALSIRLQLISSQLGAFFIGLLGIPVYLDGNIIDLGNYKIQVVEACNGLRYIYPLLSLSFLVAYFFRAPLWQRVLVFFSAIPLAIVLNSIRIGLVGITVNYWGTRAADDTLHFFEGWLVFLICAGALALVVYLLTRISGRRFLEVFFLPKSASKLTQIPNIQKEHRRPLLASLLLLGVAGAGAFYISARAEIIPERTRFVSFPQRIGSWQGHPSLLEADIERMLRPDDYLLSDYEQSDGKQINFYVAYYASQRRNDKPHSPSDCIPASGWNIASFERTTYDENQATWPLNRVIIQKNVSKQLVYYWFNERGRKVANEFLAKWYLHADAVLMNRTDGALVRLVTPIYDGESEYEADRRLRAFIHDAEPKLSNYLPIEEASRVKSARSGSRSSS